MKREVVTFNISGAARILDMPESTARAAERSWELAAAWLSGTASLRSCRDWELRRRTRSQETAGDQTVNCYLKRQRPVLKEAGRVKTGKETASARRSIPKNW